MRWGMVIDLDRCNGCQACEVACRTENNVPVCGPAAAGENRTISWIRVVGEIEGVRAAEDIECVHRMRVASRRMRNALALPFLGR